MNVCQSASSKPNPEVPPPALTAECTPHTSCLAPSALRKEVAKLMGQPTDRMGDAQWIGHILKRLHLLDDGRRKRSIKKVDS